MKILIVFYSLSGFTREAAALLSHMTGGSLLEIRDRKNRKGILGFLRSGYEGMSGKPAAIEPLSEDIGAYDLVLLCAPVWAGSLSSPMRAFVMEYGAFIKKAAYLITKADKQNPYPGIADELDRLLGKERAGFLPLVKGQGDLSPRLEEFAERMMQGL